jgi:GWxTD domain-containing protein
MLGSTLLIAALVQSADSGLLLRTVRFYRADPGQAPGVTQVTAMLRIPAGLPEAGAGGEVSLLFTARVVGQGGVLYEQTWQKRTALPFPRGEADRLDVLRFTLASGSYRIEASVTDSVSGRRAEAVMPVDAYGAPPPASDLLLSSWLRPVAPADTVPQPGEFRRGGLILAIAPEVAVGGSTATLAYLVETYSGAATDGALTFTVLDSAGTLRRRTDPTPVRLAAGIGLLTGTVDVGDLGPGRYRLVAGLSMAGRTVERESAFVVDPAAAAEPASLSDGAWFARLAGRDLERAFAPLATIAAPGELADWPVGGTDAERREFLARFWEPRDPTPATGNERRARFYDGVRYATTFYAEPARGLEGWQTDRGRIFLREGLPTQTVRRQARGRIPAYEVWRYFERGGRYYVFVDRGPRGGVALIRTNDPRERGDPRWQALLTPAGVQEIVGLVGREALLEEAPTR